MAVIREKIVLRRRKKDGERLPNRVKLDKIGQNDTLIIEIVTDKKTGQVYWYRFLPEHLLGKKAVVFTVSGSGKEVYWLSGAKPERIYEKDLPEEPLPAPIPKRRGRKPNAQKESQPSASPEKSKEQKAKWVMQFDAKQKFKSMYRDLDTASLFTHILPESIDKLCRKKKPSHETGASFRYLTKQLDFDTLLSLTIMQYDALCRRGTRIKKEE